MQNIIQREISIKASKEQVYDAITNPKKVVEWFPDSIEGECVVGGHPIFVFVGHGKAQVYITDARPYEYFAYRWVPGGSDFVGDVRTIPNTLVEFTIVEQGDGFSKVTVTESGFAELPAEMGERTFKMNSGGWDFMLGRFGKVFQA
jgi:uncharacterized protein YndB with AHSA1/START domain